ncbi:MAG: hypothetical protein RH859_08235 [Longimicrobiales bacterium]
MSGRVGSPPGRVLCVAAAALASAAGGGAAQERPPPRVAVATVAALTAQATDASGVRSEVIGSIDVFADVALGSVVLHAYVEAGTTPFSGGVFGAVPEANAVGGTALDADGTGRVQVSELRLAVPLSPRATAHVGLMDVTGFLDVSRIANDENVYFLGAPFVNNPTIAFPDYVLGGALETAIPGREDTRMALVLTSSAGLADNPGASYSDLIDVTAPGKGVFLGGRIRWASPRGHVSAGAWLDASDNPRLGGASGAEAGHGAFLVGGIDRGSHSVSARLGVADEAVAPVHRFVGMTYLWASGDDAVGLALGRSSPSSRLADAPATAHGEVFLRRHFLGETFATLSVQRIHDAGLFGGSATSPARLWVAGLRLTVPL